MSIVLDHQLREQITHEDTIFSITYYRDELASLPNWSGPLHWHPDFEIATAVSDVLDYQVGQQHIMLEAGDSIFVNGNMLHGIKQLSGDHPDPMPNIVFSGAVIAPETSTIYKKYIHPIACCDTLPFIVFKHKNGWQNKVNCSVKKFTVRCMNKANVTKWLFNVNLAIYLNIYSRILKICLNSKIRAFKSMPKYAFKRCSHIFGMFSCGCAYSTPTSNCTRTY